MNYYDELLNELNELILIQDINGRILYANNALINKLGYNKTELINKQASIIEPVIKTKSRISETSHEDSITFKTDYLTKDKKIIPVEFSTKIINYDNKKAILRIAHDITHHKRTEEELRNQNQKLMILNNITSILNNSLDTDSLIKNFINKLSELMNFESACYYKMNNNKAVLYYAYNINDKKIRKIEKFDNNNPGMIQVLKGESITTDQLLNKIPDRKNKSVAYLSLKSKNEVLGIMNFNKELKNSITYRDLQTLETAVNQLSNAIQRTKLREELIKAREDQAADNARKDLLMLITHDLKQPLTPILGYANLIKEQVKDETLQKYSNAIIRGANDLIDLINKVLNLMKLESGNLSITSTRFELANLVNTAIERKSSAMNLKKIKLFKNINKAVINGDFKLLTEVIVNLLDNAVKFSKENSEIVLNTTVTSNEVIISVKDNGVGISKEDLPKLFTKFYQTDEGRKRGGFGIGLSLIRMVIEKHKGTISVESNLGKGTTFVIKLPKA